MRKLLDKFLKTKGMKTNVCEGISGFLIHRWKFQFPFSNLNANFYSL